MAYEETKERELGLQIKEEHKLPIEVEMSPLNPNKGQNPSWITT